MRSQDVYLQKMVLNIALGVHDAAFREKVATHITHLFRLTQPLRQTRCSVPVAKWNTRKNMILGLMVTLRGESMRRLVSLLKITDEDVRADGVALRGGIASHRRLNLEKFDYRAPEYGLSYSLCFAFKGVRCWRRKIGACTKKKPIIPETVMRDILRTHHAQ